MFKGYREAEIGFIQIEESSSSRDASMSHSSRKSALFIVIHAPRRQLVEVMQIFSRNRNHNRSFLTDLGLSARCSYRCIQCLEKQSSYLSRTLYTRLVEYWINIIETVSIQTMSTLRRKWRYENISNTIPFNPQVSKQKKIRRTPKKILVFEF